MSPGEGGVFPPPGEVDHGADYEEDYEEDPRPGPYHQSQQLGCSESERSMLLMQALSRSRRSRVGPEQGHPPGALWAALKLRDRHLPGTSTGTWGWLMVL
jgi:hypothetical protein